MDFENSKSVLPPTFLEKGWGSGEGLPLNNPPLYQELNLKKYRIFLFWRL